MTDFKWQPRTRGEEGFTLVELMVVLLVIAVLVTIALPTYLGARERGHDRASQTVLRNGLGAARIVWTDLLDYAAVPSATLLTMLNTAEPTINFVAGATASTSANNYAASSRVFQYAAFIDPDYSELNVAVRSEAGECYYFRDIPAASDVGDEPGDWRGHRSQAVMPICSGDVVSGFATTPGNFQGW